MVTLLFVWRLNDLVSIIVVILSVRGTAMRTFFLGIDHRFSLLAFGYATVLSGLFMRFAMRGELEIGIFFLAGIGLMAMASLCFYRGVVANFLYMSWMAIQHPADIGLASRLESLMRMRRQTAMFMGLVIAVLNNAVMMWFEGGEVFSWASLVVIATVTATAHWGWFTSVNRR